MELFDCWLAEKIKDYEEIKVGDFQKIQKTKIGAELLLMLQNARRGEIDKTTALVGVLEEKVLGFLEHKNQKITNTAILLPDYKFAHSTRATKQKRHAALPDSVFQNLIAYFLKAEIFWDRQKSNLIYVFEAQNLPESKIAKIVVNCGIKQDIRLQNKGFSVRSNFIATGGIDVRLDFDRSRMANGELRFEKVR